MDPLELSGLVLHANRLEYAPDLLFTHALLHVLLGKAIVGVAVRE